MSDDPGAVPRPMILYINELAKAGKFGDKPLVGVEIGVLGAENAESILKTLNMEKLYLIDPYRPYMEHQAGNWHGLIDPRNKIDEAKKRLDPWMDKIHPLFTTSDRAVNSIPDGLDFVYIDGLHEYEQVGRDIRNYWLKVREMGILGGHDFAPDCLGVMAAASTFGIVNDFPLMCQKRDWWFTKAPRIIGGAVRRSQA